MATSDENNLSESGKPKKTVSANPRLAEAQKRAAAIASGSGRKPTPPGLFFEEAWVELKKTTWPNRDVLVKSTTVVLALVIGVAIWVGLIDVISLHILNYNLFGQKPGN